MTIPVRNELFETANGYKLYIDGSHSPIEALWITEAIEACSFDPERLKAIATCSLGSLPVQDFYLRFQPANSGDIPNFGVDFVNQALTSGYDSAQIALWDGLASSRPPYGGKRFYCETVIHALGHIVGEGLAYSRDIFKRQLLAQAIGTDVYGGDLGLAFSYRFFSEGHDDWNKDLRERFAEAFKDVFLAPRVRRFVNRTRARIDPAVVFSESSHFLPFGFGPALRPFTGGTPGIEMGDSLVPPNSRVGQCGGPGIEQYACIDPHDTPCKGFPCGDEGNYQTGPFCPQSYLFPVDQMRFFSWGMTAHIPNLKFCEITNVSIGGMRQSPGRSMAYLCPGPAIPTAGEIVPGGPAIIAGCDYNAYRDAGGYPLLASSDPRWAPGASSVSPRYVRPGFDSTTAQLTLDVKGPDGVATVSLRSEGYSDGIDYLYLASDDFRYAGLGVSDALIHAGWIWLPGLRGRIYAPSAGVFTDPYSRLNLDGVVQGSAKAAPAAGNAGQEINDFDYGNVPGSMGGGGIEVLGG